MLAAALWRIRRPPRLPFPLSPSLACSFPLCFSHLCELQTETLASQSPLFPAVTHLPELHQRAQELCRASLIVPVRGIEQLRSEMPPPSPFSPQTMELHHLPI
jgi:hypothetical protein